MMGAVGDETSDTLHDRGDAPMVFLKSSINSCQCRWRPTCTGQVKPAMFKIHHLDHVCLENPTRDASNFNISTSQSYWLDVITNKGLSELSGVVVCVCTILYHFMTINYQTFMILYEVVSLQIIIVKFLSVFWVFWWLNLHSVGFTNGSEPGSTAAETQALGRRRLVAWRGHRRVVNKCHQFSADLKHWPIFFKFHEVSIYNLHPQ